VALGGGGVEGQRARGGDGLGMAAGVVEGSRPQGGGVEGLRSQGGLGAVEGGGGAEEYYAAV
jgi:hypothetical protein